MSDAASQHHVDLEHYLLLFRGAMTSGEMLARMHRHVLEGCATCREGWQELVSGRRADIQELLAGRFEPIPFDPTAPPFVPGLDPSPYAAAFSAAATRLTQAATALKLTERRVRKELDQLLALPAAERETAIKASRQRFRSPAFAHLLVEEARTRVRRSPAEAIQLLDLVHPVLQEIRGAFASDWARALRVRAAAHLANAIRVAGDLPEADRRLRELRRKLAVEPLADGAVEAEVLGLEGSLRLAQRRLDEAAELLDRAVMVFEELGEREELARVLITRASVSNHQQRSDAALADLDRARRLLDPREQGFLYLCTVVGLVPILLESGRHDEAERVLREVENVAEADAEPWMALAVLYLRGRVALELGDLDRAEELLASARRGLLEQHLPHDAANAALDLALVHLHQGRTSEVRSLAREIAPYFQASGVERQALAALALLGKATAADAAALARLAELRAFVATVRAAAAKTPPN